MLALILLSPLIIILTLFILAETLCNLYGYCLIIYYSKSCFKGYYAFSGAIIILTLTALKTTISEPYTLFSLSFATFAIGLFMQEIARTRRDAALLKPQNP